MTIRSEKVVAVLIISFAIAAYYHSYFERCHSVGRTGYLAYQASHFDMYMASPTWGYPLYAGFVVAALAVILYEVICAALQRLFKKTT